MMIQKTTFNRHSQRNGLSALQTLAVGLLSLLVVSCGEFLDFESQGLRQAESMFISRKVFPMLVGDTYRIPVVFRPDTVSAPTVFWLSETDSVARFNNGTLEALSEGTSCLIAFTAVEQLRDTCWVSVLPEFYIPPSDFRYDMVVYASVDIHGTPLTAANAGGYIVVACVNDQVRGVGQMRQSRGREYMELRVWSPLDSGEEVVFRCYFRGQALMEQFPQTLTFDGGMHGTLSQPYQLVLNEQAAEYVPDIGQGNDYNPIIDPNDSIHVIIKN